MLRRNKTRDIRAEILLREGKQSEDRHSLKKALESYERAAALDPECAAAHYRMGVVLGRLGRWPEAATAYQEAIRLQPEDGDAYLNLGFVYYEQGRDEQAQLCFQRARELGSGLAKPATKMRF
jgi:tetratricopeptide (TPR) repeat protein